MSHRHDDPSTAAAPPRLAVDRIACTGKGICASLLVGAVDLDEWGYPVVRDAQVDPRMGEIAIRMCPARALSWAAAAGHAAGPAARRGPS
jgi:ferredoxin